MADEQLARAHDAALPNLETASAIACNLMGWRRARAHRFTTGAAHYVYEVIPETTGVAPIVVRMGIPDQRREMANGLALMTRLAALGVPLPTIIGYGTEGTLPWTAMERLAGSDLGHVIGGLDDERLGDIARAVAAAQAATAQLGLGEGFGYAPSGQQARFERWSQVVSGSIERSRQRMTDAGLFDLACFEAVDRLFETRREELDAIPAVPFLHDTTTRNVIVTPEGRFSGIVDVDDLCFGDPRWAPALTRAVLLAHAWPNQYVDFWMQAAGHLDDGLFRFYVAVFLLDLMSEHGQRFNGNERPSTAEARTAVLRAFEDAVVAAAA